jgi:peptidyl-prolyl cis-trans isomerase SurA
MKKAFVYLLTASFVFFAHLSTSNCENPKTEELMKTKVATVGDEKITLGELERAFKKNMNRSDSRIFNVSRDSIKDFLDLYIKYRLKVHDAIDRGFDEDPEVVADIEQNRKVLAESYYYDNNLVKPNVDKLLDMRRHEMKIAIILFSFPPVPEPDTMETYIKATKTLELLKNGGNFAQIAKDSSDDKESAQRGGEIPKYITSGKVQRPIEDAIYSLKVGEMYPELIPTKFGYFIVKLLDKQPRLKVKASHILLSEGFEEDSAAIVSKADSLLKLIRNGASFEQLAEEHSEDPSSAMRGGSLGEWYSRSTGFDGTGRHLVHDFEEAIYTLKEGEISDLVFTDYGVHIIRKDSSKSIDLERESDEIRKLYKRLYFEKDKRAFLDSLKEDYGFVINEDVMDDFISRLDTNVTTLDSAWYSEVDDDLKNKELYHILDYKKTVGEFIELLEESTSFRGIALNREGLTKAIAKDTDPIAFDEGTKNLEQIYPKFAELMAEFRDGILLFRVEKIEVWEKLKFDSTLAKEYWDTTKTRYMTETMYDISDIYVLKDSLAQNIYQQLKDGADFEELAEKFTERSGFREKKGHWGKINERTGKIYEIVSGLNLGKGQFSEPMEYGSGYTIIKVNNYEPPRMKTFEEAISDFAPEFQDILQKKLTNEWIDKIKSNVDVKIFQKEMDSALDQLKILHEKDSEIR